MPQFTGVISIQVLMARTEGGSSNTYPVINDKVIDALVKLANGLRKLSL